MPDRLITISIGRDEAVILFEMLAEFSSQPTLPVRDEAERIALFRLHGALESLFASPSDPDYRKLLDKSRSRLIGQAKV